MKIRKARIADLRMIADFNRLLASETESLTLDLATVRRGVRAVLADPSKGNYFVAEIDGVVVGQLLITHEWSDWRNGEFWWVQSVYVAEPFRGAGVFSALFDHVTALAKSRRNVCGLRLYVAQENRRAQEVYERSGMSRTHYEFYETVFARKR